MFFLQTLSNYKQRQTKTFSIAYRNDIEDYPSSGKNPLKCMKYSSARRTFFPSPRFLKGSMTLEAALVLPFFLLCMLLLYSVMDMLRIHATVTWYMHQICNEISVYGYLADLVGADEDTILNAIGDVGFSYLYIKEKLEEKVDFPGELFFSTIAILEDSEVRIALTYSYPLPIAIGKRDKVWLQSMYEGKAWTGAETGPNKEPVYVTENGSVYHLFADCTYLNLSVQGFPRENLEGLESALNRKFEACTICENAPGDLVYITINQGRYHFKRDCKGLKRTISAEEWEKVKDKYKLCERCKEREIK